MRGPLRKFVSIAALCLVATASVKSQPKPVYTKYVNTFIGTAPLNDPKILGYELPKGWRSWAALTFPAVRCQMPWCS
jgi:hypothetical protein